jgi:natural product precursor
LVVFLGFSFASSNKAKPKTFDRVGKITKLKKTMKKLNTKLTLNKESVASLNDSEMMKVQGGIYMTHPMVCQPTNNNILTCRPTCPQ